MIEDNPGDVVLIRHILAAESPSADIRVAMDGEQGLRVLADREFLPDLIILDLNIPRIPGITLLEQYKPTAPVVVFSSSSNPTEIRRARELGVREFVQNQSISQSSNGWLQGWFRIGPNRKLIELQVDRAASGSPK